MNRSIIVREDLSLLLERYYILLPGGDGHLRADVLEERTRTRKVLEIPFPADRRVPDSLVVIGHQTEPDLVEAGDDVAIMIRLDDVDLARLDILALDLLTARHSDALGRS